MRKAVIVAWCLVGAGCGRVGFAPTGGDAAGDGTIGDAPGDGPPGLSCSGLASTCGPAGTSSCCGSPVVPGGSFFRSFDVGTDDAYPDMTNPAVVSDFRLDTYEVTVGRFRQFVTAGMGTQLDPPAIAAGARTLNGTANQGGWDASFTSRLVADTAALGAAVRCNTMYQTWTDVPGANESLPMNCITWYEAMAFCAWDGGFLPTEAEWNYAAAGGDEQRAYPWSSPASSLTIDCSYASYNFCANPPMGGTAPVGSASPRGDGKWGHSDLGGNVWEWTIDRFVEPYPNPCSDCADLTLTGARAVRGANFAMDESWLRGAYRLVITPTDRSFGIGARCARTP